MVKWIDEKVLQRYFKENCSEYSLRIRGKEKTIEGCDYNPNGFNRFPDLNCRIEDETYPAEVEWLSSHYNHNEKDPKEHERYVDRSGFLIVFGKDKEVGNLKQIQIKQEHFRKWFRKNAGEILDESVKSYQEEAVKERDYPKIWAVYIAKDMIENFEVGLNRGIWGFTEGRLEKSGEIQEIQKRDIVLFLGPIAGGPSGPSRFSPWRDSEEFYKMAQDSSVKIDQINAYLVMKGYWNEKKESKSENRSYRVIWPDEDEENKKYPHRFKFYRNEIVQFSDVKLKKIARATIEELRKVMSSSPREQHYPHFVELLSHFSTPQKQ